MENNRLRNHLAGKDFYQKETCDGSRVFTLRAARKYDLETLQAILDYWVASGKLDARVAEKDAYSLQNVIKAMREKSNPPTEAEMESLRKVFTEFQRTHHEFTEKYEEEERC